MDIVPSFKTMVAAESGFMLLYLFFFLAAIAVARSRTKRLRELGRNGVSGSRYARVLIQSAERSLLGAQIGMFMCALGMGYHAVRLCAHPELHRRALELFARIGGDRYIANEYFCMALQAFGLMLLAFAALVLVQIARAFAFTYPERILCALALPILVVQRLLRPWERLLSAVVDLILKVVGASRPLERDLPNSVEEISEIVELSGEAGEIAQDEREMIAGVIGFSDTVVREVMTPRKDIVSIEEGATLDEILGLFIAEGFSRVLVTGETLDDVKGILLAKDLLPYVGHATIRFDMAKLLRKPYFVPNTKKIDDLLQELRREVNHFAVVMDEHGGVDGIVTLEDLLEEIVGEIFDEFDSPAEEREVRLSKSGDLLVDGGLMMEELNRKYHFDLPLGEYDTVAGFVIHTLGRIPKPGELLQCDGVRIRVEEVEQNRITLVRLIMDKNTSDSAALQSVPKAAEPPPASAEEAPAERKARISAIR